MLIDLRVDNDQVSVPVPGPQFADGRRDEMDLNQGC